MFPRRLLAGAAAAASTLIALTIVAPAAHATEFPSLPSATATMQCDHDPVWDYDHANWHVHIANSAQALSDAHFEVDVDALPPNTATLMPGETQDFVLGAPDGLPTHVTVAADGKTLVDKTITSSCNTPYADEGFACPQFPNAPATLNFGIGNSMSKPIDFEVHTNKGLLYKGTHYDQEGKSLGFHEPYNEGDHYHGWITMDGVTVKDLDGVVDCEQTPTSTPPSTTPTTQPTSTTTTVAAVPAGDPPSSPTTTVSPAGQTLPFTGGSSAALAVLGTALLGAGAALVLGMRRRSART